MFEFKHPKHYAELRAERRKLQATSDSTGGVPGNADITVTSVKLQAASDKLQADSSSKRQASSPKQQASSDKPQATSSMIREPRNI